MNARLTSRRERRLWTCAAVVIGGIYATIGLAGTLADRLRSEGLLAAAFGLMALILLAVFAGSGLKGRPRPLEIWAAIGIAAVYGMVVVRMFVSPAERSHLIEYGLVAVLLHQAFVERGENGRPVRAAALVAILMTTLVGWVDELIQAMIPNRVYDLRDVGFNALAATMAVAASMLMTWVRWRVGRRAER